MSENWRRCCGHLHDRIDELTSERDALKAEIAERSDDLTRALAEVARLKGGRRCPLLSGGSIPWAIAEEAYLDYSKRYGTDQSLERLAQRGGFAPEELDRHRPGWRPAKLLIDTLTTERDQARSALSEALAALRRYGLHDNITSATSDACAKWDGGPCTCGLDTALRKGEP